jgi:hypothetical protein
MVDAARSAVSRNNAHGALELVERHEEEYPSGAFVEEREVIRIRALALLGRRDDAEEQARRFREQHPHSLLWPSVRALLGGGEAARSASPRDVGPTERTEPERPEEESRSPR